MVNGYVCTVAANACSNNHDGIWIYYSNGNTVTNNAVGVYIFGGARNNAIYNNNFINNQAQTSISPTTTDNLFTLDRPIGGNYWSDRTGPDEDADGFVDKPYAFKYGQDSLPWAAQDGWASRLASAFPPAIRILPPRAIPTSLPPRGPNFVGSRK
jgi:parallel beta-helix repeat protein